MANRNCENVLICKDATLFLNLQRLQASTGPCEWQQTALSWLGALSLSLLLLLVPVQSSSRPALAHAEQTEAVLSLQGGAATLTKPRTPSTQELKVSVDSSAPEMGIMTSSSATLKEISCCKHS